MYNIHFLNLGKKVLRLYNYTINVQTEIIKFKFSIRCLYWIPYLFVQNRYTILPCFEQGKAGFKISLPLRRSTHAFYTTHLAMQMMPDGGTDRTSFVLRPINATIRHHLHSKVGGVKRVLTTTQRAEIFWIQLYNVLCRHRIPSFFFNKPSLLISPLSFFANPLRLCLALH
jgi:hypothetical protein